MENMTLTLEQLAEIFHVTPKTMKYISATTPERLPPRIEYKGRRVLFLKSDVEKWLKERSQAI